jgi:hypothetical protein
LHSTALKNRSKDSVGENVKSLIEKNKTQEIKKTKKYINTGFAALLTANLGIKIYDKYVKNANLTEEKLSKKFQQWYSDIFEKGFISENKKSFRVFIGKNLKDEKDFIDLIFMFNIFSRRKFKNSFKRISF